jgi:hypothetical protein
MCLGIWPTQIWTSRSPIMTYACGCFRGKKGRNKKWGSSLTDRSVAKNNFPGANVSFTILTMPVEKNITDRQSIYILEKREKTTRKNWLFCFSEGGRQAIYRIVHV